MSYASKIGIIGRLGKDAEPPQDTRRPLRLSVCQEYGAGQGVYWHTIAVWPDNPAYAQACRLRKGDLVAALCKEGTPRTWTGNDGQERVSVDHSVYDLLLPAAAGDARPATQPQRPAAPPPPPPRAPGPPAQRAPANDPVGGEQFSDDEIPF